MKVLTEEDWTLLMELIDRGTCVLVLGPGVSAVPGSDEGVGLTECLVNLMSAQMEGERVCELGNLHQAAQLYVQCPKLSRIHLEALVKKFYKPLHEETTPLHRDLAKLPFTLCVNATFDSFLLNAFRAEGKHPVFDYYHFRRLEHRSPLSRIDPEFLKDPRRPVVYNLYGACEDATSLVLTENDLLEFLVKVVRREPPLPDFIRARFSDRGVSFLFLGFGFRHWYMRILLHVLQAHSHQNPSVAMEDARFFSHPEREQLVVFFEREHRIYFRQEGWENFAAELRKRYQASAPRQPGEPDGDLPPEAPKVFLCHDSRDKSRVEDLGRALQARDIAIWLDRQNLRGGDDWERLIPSVIKGQVDYVVVVQSAPMVARKESVLYAEIKAALDRQKNFAEDTRFLIPVHLQADSLLNELSHLHSVDLTRPDGIQKLAQTILEDWNRPGRRGRNP